ncbi:hypothetical protein EH243_01275 [Amphritea opalescens]|uniref:NB-ARC domain-containing protein n=1 Tax=Amphritea opalescens TaxID=2490544 RepID=A0A430KVW6_9GAMM|nr:hypothetical protein [Amphritea opalescens]RTE67608.1 hypothetical protein EH243_01275 [Amphritea opalescens]
MGFLKRVFIKKIVDDLISINGTEFEYFCKPVFEIITGESSIHKGSNLFAKPISRTVDFSNNNFEVVGQCGTDNNYFDVFGKNFDDLIKLKVESTKPIKDVLSALKNSVQCSKIILFANQEAKGGRLDSVNKVIRHIGIEKDVVIFDSEGIAQIIADNIGNQKFILSLIDYLPTASQIYSAISMQNDLPTLPSDFITREDESPILELVSRNKVSIIHGVSGIGKSKIALGIAHKLKGEFDSILWVNLGENEDLNFKSVKVGDFDKNLNLANLCATYKTLVILDNFSGNVSDVEVEFEKISRAESRVLITSLGRSARREICFHLSEMNIEESKKFINRNIDIDSKHVDEIVDHIGGHPLCLELVCQIIREEEYSSSELDNFLVEISQISEEVVRGKSQTISDLVIGKYSEKFHREFALISLIDSEQISNFIFNKILGMKAIRNLEKLSLIIRSGINHSSIHSVVLLSINNLSNLSHEREQLKDEICEVLLVENEFKRSSYYSFCVMHNKLLNELYKQDLSDINRKALLYAIIQTTDNLVFKSDLIDEVEKFDLSHNNMEDLLLLIEKLELRLISVDRKQNEDEYQFEAEQVIKKLDEINLNLTDKSNIRLLVEHHIAKIYFWKGDAATAKRLFTDLLCKFPNSEQCMLQLARIYDNEKSYDKVEKYVETFLSNINPEQSYSVVLSFYDLISNSQYTSCREKYIQNRVEDFVSDISATLRSSFDHPYRVLSSLSSYLGYNLPEAFESLCSNLPAPDNVIENKKLMMAYADIQMSLYRLYKYSQRQDREQKLNETSKLAEQYYIECQPANDFDNLKVAKFFIEIEKYKKARYYLNKIEKKDPFYYQNAAKQLRGVNDDKGAIIAIDEAITGAQRGDCKTWFLSSFLNDKAEILNRSDTDKALEVLAEAIEKQNNPKTKKAWQAKADRWAERC